MNREEEICSCLGLTYGDIEDAFNNGADSYEKIVEVTSVGTICGICEDDVKEFIDILLKK